ncbi:MAG: hypothetical protein KDB00_10480 [Planctomycetales bacterium]|nr:hypothetical protein [Planctomycetales bacterium]
MKLSPAEHRAGNTDQAKQAFENAEAWHMKHRPFNTGIIRLREIASPELAH